jgi:hypothetical protein
MLMRPLGLPLLSALLLACVTACAASPNAFDPATSAALPALRPAPSFATITAPPITPATPRPLPALARPPAIPRQGRPDPALGLAERQLVLAFRREVPDAWSWPPAKARVLIARAQAQLAQSSETIDSPQLIVAVDRNPAAQHLAIVLARPDGPWDVIGGGRVSTGQGGRKDYYFTPVGVFAHTDAILDFRAEGTYNENNIRGLGVAGMRVWDFGWQWAVKGWRPDGEGGDIRLQMHATDPAVLEQRLGRPASEGCVRVSSAMNRFLDRHGILDRDVERAAATDISYRALLGPDHQPTPLAGRLLIVVDSRDPIDAPPTSASRPPDVVAGSE